MQSSVLEYLEKTVRKFPDKIAITDKDREITFSEWRECALALASCIIKKSDGAKIPILVYLPKTVDIPIAFAGILYSGNYYTPTDVNFPFEKVSSIIRCLHPQIIISNKNCAKKLLENGVPEQKILYTEEIEKIKGTKKEEDMKEEAQRYLEKIIDTDLAYVFFTSGSTGVPKGVSITHRSIVDYIDWVAETFQITEKEKIANQAPFYFDNSIMDLYLCMSRGAHLYITPEMYFAFTAKLLEYLRDNEINYIFWVPSALINVANSGLLEKIDCSCVRKVLFCGEVMPNRHLNIWRKNLPDAVYANLYGPTEITDVCSYYVVDREFSDEEPLPIGKACKNTELLILNDANERIHEPNKTGELCVRGTSLAVGYYDNPEKTTEAFVQNPLNPYYEEKIYRTGDLVHYNEFGELMFDGRKDFQIKHMGYRIELGEIETAILSHPDVENACCIYDEEQSVITAFCKSRRIEEKELRKALALLLPKYMIPGAYIFLEEFPYNDNGKIDRKLLKKMHIASKNE